MNWPHNQSFRYRILLGCLLVALIPLTVSSVITLQVYDRTLQSQSREEGARQLRAMNQQLEELFDSYDRVTDQLSRNLLVIEALRDPGRGDREDIYLELYRATDDLRGVSQFFLYDAGGILRYTTETAPTRISLPIRWGVLRKAAEAPHMAYYDMDDTGAQPRMKAARCIRLPTGQIAGYAVVNLTEDAFQALFSGFLPERSSMVLVDEFWSPVYAYPAGDIEARLPRLRSVFTQTGSLDAAGEAGGYRYQVMRNPASGYYLILEQTAAVSGGARETMRTISLAAAAVSLLLCVWVSVLLSRSLARPVRELNDAMDEVKRGNLDVRLEPRRSDELGQLTESFNLMTQDLQVHVESLVQRQRDLNEARIRMLQAQLNPHFLYNTLDTMKWTAKMSGVQEVAAMAEALAVILRQGISSEQFVTLRQELDMIESYIGIQKIRFSGRFQYVVDLPEELEDCMIPKLILQPLVENAILHGLENSDNGYIYVYAARQEDRLRVSVTDDGVGMAPETVERLNSGESIMVEGHLGLYNVSQIIRLYYGSGYGLHASAQPGVGTTVTVVLPVRKEEDHAESGDR